MEPLFCVRVVMAYDVIERRVVTRVDAAHGGVRLTAPGGVWCHLAHDIPLSEVPQKIAALLADAKNKEATLDKGEFDVTISTGPSYLAALLADAKNKEATLAKVEHEPKAEAQSTGRCW